MGEILAEIAEIEDRINIARENIRQLTEQATAFSGAHDEELTAQRIADQEAEIERLMESHAELTNSLGAGS